MPGVYAAADTAAVAKRAIRAALEAHLAALSELGRSPAPRADVLVLRYDPKSRLRRTALRYVGLGSVMGQRTSKAKAEASRLNGRKGGRPRKQA